ncbi:MAG: rod shape-determining protein RodA [Flavobacteriaceae bacterium]|nr:rod shape-determining protein RodA [Flavobacteriaceae bacterium]
MSSNKNILLRIDWITVFIYFALVLFGWINIYSAKYNEEVNLSLLESTYSKQSVFIGLSLLIITFVFVLEAKFYERFASVFYMGAIGLLLGLFALGNTIAGETSWYNFGGIGLQPSEFAKSATVLAIAKFLSDIQTNLKQEFKDQLKAFAIIFVPVLIILVQSDEGSALVYLSLLIVLYREGLPNIYIYAALTLGLIFIATVAVGILWTSVGIGLLVLVLYIFRFIRIKRFRLILHLIIAGALVGFSFFSDYFFNNILEPYQQDRINLALGKKEKVTTVGRSYNTDQSIIAIGSGGISGKGWMSGTQTKGDFVPEQHTDYIFSTIGEEWGFVGCFAVILTYAFLIIRIMVIAERQKNKFSRIYGYGVACILFTHFAINIGMVIGIMPTIGIPLPYISYGGSSLWGFTILLFIFLKLDANRINEW